MPAFGVKFSNAKVQNNGVSWDMQFGDPANGYAGGTKLTLFMTQAEAEQRVVDFQQDVECAITLLVASVLKQSPSFSLPSAFNNRELILDLADPQVIRIS